jgi:AcrR family transcriptional regulator
MNMVQRRMPASDRRREIIAVVRDLFAQKGFDGVTTRELAKAAGISQTLIYKHFPSKQSLFTAISEDCLTRADLEDFRKIVALEPSTATLVLLVHFIVSKILIHSEAQNTLDMLVVRSLLSDGEFVLNMHEDIMAPWYAKVDQSLKAAVRAGEAQDVPSAGMTGAPFVHSLAMGLMLTQRPKRKAINMTSSREQLVEKGVWCALLGLGVKAGAIRRYYAPKTAGVVPKA